MGELNLLVLVQLGLLAVFALAAEFASGAQLAASILIGGAIMIVNVGLLRWSSARLFAKKSIAWTSVVIVIKYAVLLGSIFYLSRTSWFSLPGAGLGIISFVFATLVMAAVINKKDKNEAKG